MPLNDAFVPPTGQTRTPAVQILANGTALPGVIEVDIHSNNHFAADRFDASLALSAAGAAWWADQADVFLDIQLRLNGPWQSITQGMVDTVHIDPLRNLLRVEGRDLTARFIEARTQESFTNNTSSEVIQILATRAGLTADVTPTSTPVGRYYELEHDVITLNQFSKATTQWELMVFLAQHEMFDIYVSGSTLHFQPPAPASLQPVVLRPADLVDLQLQRSLTLAHDIEVTVKSWNSRQRNAFTQTARSANRGQGAGSRGTRDQTQRYVFVRPNLSQAAALQFAQNMLTELSRHERVITATMPGELSLTPRGAIQLLGTGTGFDQIYYISSIERSLSVARGFTQTVQAKNMTAAADATPPALTPPAL